MVTCDIVNDLLECNTHIPSGIHIYKESSSDVQDALVESSVSSHDTRYSPSEPRIEEETEYEVIDISVATSDPLRFLSMFDRLLLIFHLLASF